MYLYITSRGHSGSTILDILLGNSRAIESVGELNTGINRADEPCGCGLQVRDCPFWQTVRRTVEQAGFSWQDLARKTFAQAHVKSQPRTWLARPDDPAMKELAAMSAAVASGVAAASGKPHMLDSGKEPTRALMLLKYLPEARVIHLVRDPRSIQQSHYWRIKSGWGFKFLRRNYKAGWTGPFFLLLSAVSWTFGNILCELACRKAPDRSVRIHYEDLRDDPKGVVARIAEAFDLDLDDIQGMLDRHEAFPVGHNIGGNQIRHDKAVTFDPQKERSRTPLPRWVEIMTIACCWPLMRRYGYREAGRRAAGGPAAIAAAGRPRDK